LKRPLAGKRVLVTRAEAQAGEAANLLRDKGASPVIVPTIVLGPPDDPSLAAHAVLRLGDYDWVAFTSANGVERTLEALSDAGKNAGTLAGNKIAAVGPATALALTKRGIAVDLVAKESHGEGLAKEMLALASPPRRLVLFRAQVAREAFPEAMRAAGCTVDVVPVYATLPAPGLSATLAGLFSAADGLDAALFSSGSTVTHVCDALGPEATTKLAKVVVAVIGPVTREAAETRGVRVDVEADPRTLPALVEALEAYFAGRS
jgi:uroporphyrinogen III methyltransferase / synthase